MRLALLLLMSIWLVCAPAIDCHSQNAQNPQQGAGDQWVSHQMNQPPPNPEKFMMSKETVDEIKQLYLDAKKEVETKAPAPDPRKKK
jgi:hypothetical protein